MQFVEVPVNRPAPLLHPRDSPFIAYFGSELNLISRLRAGVAPFRRNIELGVELEIVFSADIRLTSVLLFFVGSADNRGEGLGFCRSVRQSFREVLVAHLGVQSVVRAEGTRKIIS